MFGNARRQDERVVGIEDPERVVGVMVAVAAVVVSALMVAGGWRGLVHTSQGRRGPTLARAGHCCGERIGSGGDGGDAGLAETGRSHAGAWERGRGRGAASSRAQGTAAVGGSRARKETAAVAGEIRDRAAAGASPATASSGPASRAWQSRRSARGMRGLGAGGQIDEQRFLIQFRVERLAFTEGTGLAGLRL